MIKKQKKTKKTWATGLYSELTKQTQAKKVKGGILTLAKLRKLYNAVCDSKDVPTHYWDENGKHKINAKTNNN